MVLDFKKKKKKKEEKKRIGIKKKKKVHIDLVMAMDLDYAAQPITMTLVHVLLHGVLLMIKNTKIHVNNMGVSAVTDSENMCFFIYLEQWFLTLLEVGARCSSVVRAFAHGIMGRRIDLSWGWTH